MSKAMAIDSIMKLFLMVAVIIVGMSFLMKTFGIDIIGWLEDKFKGFKVPPDGRFLHISLDPEDNQLWEFHLTNGEFPETYNYRIANRVKVHPANIDAPNQGIFTLESSGRTIDGCVMLATNEESGIVAEKSAIYYVSPGATIQDDCGENLFACLKSYFTKDIFECNIMTVLWGNGAPSESPYSPTNCRLATVCNSTNNPFCLTRIPVNAVWSEEESTLEFSKQMCKKRAYSIGTYLGALQEGCSIPFSGNSISDLNGIMPVLGYPFKFNIENGGDVCKNKGVCNLLFPNEDERGQFHYKVKYGLICGRDGKWHTCTDSTKSDFQDGDCDFNGYRGVWASEIQPQILSLALANEDFSSQPKLTLKSKSFTATTQQRPYGFESSVAGLWDTQEQRIILTKSIDQIAGVYETSLKLNPYAITEITTSFKIQTYGGTGGDATWFYLFSETTPFTEDQNAQGYRVVFDEKEDEIQIYYNLKLYGTKDDPSHGLIQSIDNGQPHQIMIKFKIDGDKHLFTITYSDDDNVPSTKHTIEKVFTATDKDISGMLFGWGARAGVKTNGHYLDNVYLIAVYKQ